MYLCTYAFHIIEMKGSAMIIEFTLLQVHTKNVAEIRMCEFSCERRDRTKECSFVMQKLFVKVEYITCVKTKRI